MDPELRSSLGARPCRNAYTWPSRNLQRTTSSRRYPQHRIYKSPTRLLLSRRPRFPRQTWPGAALGDFRTAFRVCLGCIGRWTHVSPRVGRCGLRLSECSIPLVDLCDSSVWTECNDTESNF